MQVRFRVLEGSDVPACIDIRTRSIAEYQGRLGVEYRAGDRAVAEAVLRHLRTTDPARVVVAEQGAGASSRVVGYAAASLRGDSWFLGALFVAPASAGAGIGPALLRAVMPGTGSALPGGRSALMTCTDSLQPISNAMYARLGVVPRVPVFRATADEPGTPVTDPAWRYLQIPEADSSGWTAALELVRSVDRNVLGYEHDLDHAFVRRHATEGIVITTSGDVPIGYGYRHPNGELGPIAAIDAADLSAMVRTMAGRVRGGTAGVWAAGASDRLLPDLLGSGFRIVGFPALACWDRPTVDLARYVPWSLTLL